MATAVPLLAAAFTANELGAENGLLLLAHYDALHHCISTREPVPGAGETEEQHEQRLEQMVVDVLTRQSAAAAVLEFCFAQLAGQLSDALGRRPVLLVAAFCSGICRCAPLVAPDRISSVWLAKVGGDPFATVYMDTIFASVADLFVSDAHAYGAMAGRLRALGGCATLLGPALGSRLAQKHHGRPFLGASLCSVVMALLALRLPETATTTGGGVSWRGALPLGWVGLLTRRGSYAGAGAVVPVLALALAFQRMAMFGTFDVGDAHCRSWLRWSGPRLGVYRSCEGFAYFVQGILAGVFVSLNPLLGSLLGNSAAAAAFLCWGFAMPDGHGARSLLMWAGLALSSIPVESVPEALLVHAGAMAGVGEGKLMADLSSITALAKMMGPVVMGKAFSRGRVANRPSLWGELAASCYGISQALMMVGGVGRLRA